MLSSINLLGANTGLHFLITRFYKTKLQDLFLDNKNNVNYDVLDIIVLRSLVMKYLKKLTTKENLLSYGIPSWSHEKAKFHANTVLKYKSKRYTMARNVKNVNMNTEER